MLDVLYQVESALPELLADEAGWTGVYADTERPILQRLWRQWGDYRVYLHRLQGCAPEEAFLHPHPWASAMRVLAGRYETAVGASADPASPPPSVIRLVLEPGSSYEMTHPDGWHLVRPVGDECFSLMVAGPVIWERNRIPANAPVRPLEPDERRMLFSFFRSRYPFRNEGR